MFQLQSKTQTKDGKYHIKQVYCAVFKCACIHYSERIKRLTKYKHLDTAVIVV